MFTFFPALLKYNWHKGLCMFKVYNVMIWDTWERPTDVDTESFAGGANDKEFTCLPK